MKVLVTGAAGFIGSAVVRKLLGRGREVRCLVEPNVTRKNLEGLDVELVEGAVNDREAVARALAGCDTLFHLAAIYALWLPDPERIYEVNVEGTKTVLWAAYRANLSRVVHTSSIAAIGRRDDGQPADESSVFGPRDWAEGNAYSRSKWLSERDALRFAREGLPLVVVNPAFPFGERDRGPTPTGKFIVEALHRRLYGYPDGGFCAVDVDVVAEGHVLAAEQGRVGERYILGEHNVRYEDFFRAVTRAAGLPPQGIKLPRLAALALAWMLEHVDRDLRDVPPRVTYQSTRLVSRSMFFDVSKARTELGLPTRPLPDTLERAVRWFRDNGYAPPARP